MRTILQQDNDSIIISWTYRPEYSENHIKFNKYEENQSLLYIAEYDADFKEIKQIYSDKNLIDHIIELNKEDIS